ncbi:MAG: GH25 family lysozyme [Bacteroidota bacterium]|nr:GH25 family lysozyme [Bacteroidota bacterium]
MSRRRKKKFTSRTIFYFTLIVFLAAGVWLGNKWLKYRRAKFSHYAEFGISIPGYYSIHGIDVSKYQDIIAWEEVKAMKVRDIQIGFVFIKATEGIDNVDPQFRRNWKKAKSNNIIRGAYHFFIASKDGKMQAENFIKKAELETGDLPPVLDVEQRNGVSSAQLRKETKKWLETAENYYHTKPIIYTNVDFYNNYLGNEFDNYPLWVAHYYEEQQPRIHRDWIFWQHNDQGNVNGITSKVDFSVFCGDSLAFKSLLIH